jgi:hypothetical protein
LKRIVYIAVMVIKHPGCLPQIDETAQGLHHAVQRKKGHKHFTGEGQ